MAQVAVMPIELMEEILLKLPIESLLRFKRVSKQWLTLITNSRFALRHYPIAKDRKFASFFLVPLQFHNKNDYVTHLSVDASHHSVNVLKNIGLDYDWNSSMMKIREGFMVSVGFGFYYIFDIQGHTARLWNPATRESCWFSETSVPPLRSKWLDYFIRDVFCFGKVDYEDGNLSYIVGQIIQYRIPYDFHNHNFFSIELYSSKTKSWKFIPGFCTDEFLDNGNGNGHCVSLNGKAHWMMLSGEDEEEFNITTFDYETDVIEKFVIRLVPEVGYYYHQMNTFLTLWDETLLCLVLGWIKDDIWFSDIWVMDEYGVENSWSKKFTVGLGLVPCDVQVLAFSSKMQCLFLRRNRYPVTSLENDLQIIFLSSMCSSYFTLRLCGLKSPNFDGLPLNGMHWDGELQIAEHVESLFSVLN